MNLAEILLELNSLINNLYNIILNRLMPILLFNFNLSVIIYR